MRSTRLGSNCSWAILVTVALAACSPEPRWIAVAGNAGTFALVFDADLTNSDTLRSLGPITGLHFGPDGTTLYLATYGDGGATIARVARATGLVLLQQVSPQDTLSGLWFLRDGRTLVTAGTTTLYFLPASLSDPGKEMEICEEPIGGFTPLGVRDRAYAVCGESTLVEIDTDLQIAVRSATFPPCGAEDVATSPSGTIVYVLCRTTGTLLYIDRLTLAPLDSVDLGVGGHAMALASGGRQAVVSRPDADEVAIVDLRQRTVEARLRVDTPWAVAVGMDGHYAYVTAQRPGRLLRIDLDGAAVTGERQMLSGPLQITLWPGTESPRLSFPALQPAKP